MSLGKTVKTILSRRLDSCLCIPTPHHRGRSQKQPQVSLHIVEYVVAKAVGCVVEGDRSECGASSQNRLPSPHLQNNPKER